MNEKLISCEACGTPLAPTHEHTFCNACLIERGRIPCPMCGEAELRWDETINEATCPACNWPFDFD